jgi:putative transposase
VQRDSSRPGKPVDNSVCEAFNGSIRRECLTRHWFVAVAEAEVELSTRRAVYHTLGHTSLGMQPQLDIERAGITSPGR